MGGEIALQQELVYYNEHQQEFLAKAEGKFILIKGQESFGFFDNETAAYNKGADLFGNTPFLIQQVTAEDEVQQLPAYVLGLIYADFRSSIQRTRAKT